MKQKESFLYKGINGIDGINRINGNNKWFTAVLYKEGSVFKSKNNIISISLNESNNCCLYSLESEHLICSKLL